MKRGTSRVVLTFVVGCVLLTAASADRALAQPEATGLAGVGAVLGASSVSLESPVEVPPVRVRELAEAPGGREKPAVDREPRSAPAPLGSPAAPTPLGIALAGLVGVGVLAYRRERRLRAPLV